MIVLGIDTSCDDTAVAVVADGRHIRSSVVMSQQRLHAEHGGVVPEVASRRHLQEIGPAVTRALDEAGLDLAAIGAVAATVGPGLPGSLMVGYNFARALALGLKSAAGGLPFVPVNHLEGHIYSAWLLTGHESAGAARAGEEHVPVTLAGKNRTGAPIAGPEGAGAARAGEGRADVPGDLEPALPLVVLIVSGGHTELVLMRGHGAYRRLGSTRDDAAGEAFDKVGRLLGLGYPGGPAVQRAAAALPRDAQPIKMPRAWLKGSYDFSFSGLKTAALHLVEATAAPADDTAAPAADRAASGAEVRVSALAAGFQDSVADVLATKTAAAAREFAARGVVLCGGVAANSAIREARRAALPPGIPLHVPPPSLCTDNGAMIAAAGYYRLSSAVAPAAGGDVRPGLTLPVVGSP